MKIKVISMLLVLVVLVISCIWLVNREYQPKAHTSKPPHSLNEILLITTTDDAYIVKRVDIQFNRNNGVTIKQSNKTIVINGNYTIENFGEGK